MRGTTTDGRAGTFLTRAGQFAIDKDGYLVNADGLRVQGYTANAAGDIVSASGDLLVGNANASPSPTSNITMKANLNSDSPGVAAAFDPANATATSSFAGSVSIVNPLGKTIEAHLLPQGRHHRRLGLARGHRRRQRERRHGRQPASRSPAARSPSTPTASSPP